MWFIKGIATDANTGRQQEVVCTMEQFGCPQVYPTFFFEHFNKAPVFNVMSDLDVSGKMEGIPYEEPEDESVEPGRQYEEPTEDSI